MKHNSTDGVPACEAPDIHALIDRLDGYLNSPEQIALRDDLLAALRALGVKECRECRQTGLTHCQHPNECGGPWTTPAAGVLGKENGNG